MLSTKGLRRLLVNASAILSAVDFFVAVEITPLLRGTLILLGADNFTSGVDSKGASILITIGSSTVVCSTSTTSTSTGIFSGSGLGSSYK